MRKRYRDRKWLQQRYWKEKLSTCQIGEISGVTRATIRRWMIRHNIARRTPSKAQEGKYISENTKRKISKALRGRKPSLETRQKRSGAMCGRFKGEKHPFWGKRGEEAANWKGGRTYHSNGYVLIWNADHPCADSHGYVGESRLAMEDYLGRHLGREEIVHHINGIKDDNRIDNLVLFPSQAEHMAFHRKADDFLNWTKVVLL